MTYNDYKSHMQKLADVEYSIGVLSWDKEVNLQKKGAAFRSRQVATLAGIAHSLFTEKGFGETLKALDENGKDLSPGEAKNVTLTRKDYKRSSKFSEEFVMRSSQITSETYHAWLKAREANDYSLYEEALGKMVEIKREAAEIIGYEGHPYDALLDEFEPDYTSAQLDTLFADVKAKLVKFAANIRNKKQVSNEFVFQHFDKDEQWELGLDLLAKMGYDFDAGRQDVSPHPFTINFSPDDVRVTTRVDENDLANMVWSCIHEGGHALYEQGLKSDEYGLPLGRAISLGIHESQSRLWENNVGRGLSYWNAHYPALQDRFPEQLKAVSLEDFWKGINRIEPNLIRTEADELHYHFHVMIRYEIEKGLIEGSISTKGLDKVWNAKYKEYLGVDVPDANQGILQDIHWAHGSLGYFPTYSLGSFYAAQFYKQAEKDIPNLKAQIEAGDTSKLLDWLRENIHVHGKMYDANELCVRITGEELNFQYFMDYIEGKYGEIYS
ncbi:MAG: carboxypeptidase Taq [Saprospiraceae bacterium]|jgi:carboxypeptidase Taq